MDSFIAYCFIMTGMLAVDACARRALPKERRTAGLVALLVLCLCGKSAYHDKTLAIKRFFLSVLLIIFMLLASKTLLIAGIPEQASLLDFAVLLSPLFIMPFYHFLYELLGVRALLVSPMLLGFRLRGALALLLSANIIFISLNPLNSLFSLLGHFLLAYLAILGMFYLCSLARRKPSKFDIPTENNDEALEPQILRYSLSVMEIFYYLCLLFFVFLAGVLQMFSISGHWFFIVVVGFLLLITTAINKMHNLSLSFLLSFYENKAVPLSFIFFGLTHIFSAYL